MQKCTESSAIFNGCKQKRSVRFASEFAVCGGRRSNVLNQHREGVFSARCVFGYDYDGEMAISMAIRMMHNFESLSIHWHCALLLFCFAQELNLGGHTNQGDCFVFRLQMFGK